MASHSNGSCDLVGEVFKHVEGVEYSADRLVQLTTLLTSLICLLTSLILNTYITANIAYKKRIKVVK